MRRLLIVEDDPDIAVLIDYWLSAQATTRLRHSADEITEDDIAWCDTVLADYMMPGTTGCQVLAMFKEFRPEVRRVLWTAVNRVPGNCPEAEAILYKPATLAEIQAAINGR